MTSPQCNRGRSTHLSFCSSELKISLEEKDDAFGEGESLGQVSREEDNDELSVCPEAQESGDVESEDPTSRSPREEESSRAEDHAAPPFDDYGQFPEESSFDAVTLSAARNFPQEDEDPSGTARLSIESFDEFSSAPVVAIEGADADEVVADSSKVFEQSGWRMRSVSNAEDKLRVRPTASALSSPAPQQTKEMCSTSR